MNQNHPRKLSPTLKKKKHHMTDINDMFQSVIEKCEKAEIACAAADAEIRSANETIAQLATKRNENTTRMLRCKKKSEEMLKTLIEKYQVHTTMRTEADANIKRLAYAFYEAAIIDSGDDVGNAIATLDHMNAVYSDVHSNYAAIAKSASDIADMIPEALAMFPEVRNAECFHGEVDDVDSMIKCFVVKYQCVNHKCSEAKAIVDDFHEAVSRAETMVGLRIRSTQLIKIHEKVELERMAATGEQELVDQLAEAQSFENIDLDTAINTLIRLIMKFREVRSLRSDADLNGIHVQSAFQKLIASTPFYRYIENESASEEIKFESEEKSSDYESDDSDEDGSDDESDIGIDNSVVHANSLMNSLLEHMSCYEIDDL